METSKRDFILRYLLELDNATAAYYDAGSSERDGAHQALVDEIVKICEVLHKDIPDLEYGPGSILLGNDNTTLRDAEIVKDILKWSLLADNSSVEPQHSAKDGEPLIFISHCSADKNYGDALEKFITGLGVKNHQLIYSSHPLHKIPLDVNIYQYLRKHINSNIMMIILWSNAYLDSPACLNEMGAAWVVQCDYTSIFVPTFDFGNPKFHQCAVDTSKMGAILRNDEHCKTNMLELKDKIQKMFGLMNDEKNTTYILDRFMKEISEE